MRAGRNDEEAELWEAVNPSWDESFELHDKIRNEDMGGELHW